MGLFTRLTDRDVARLAAEFSLGTVVGWKPIAAGTINSNFRVETVLDTDHPHAETTSWFLRVNEGKSEEDVAYEAKLVESFAAGGVPTPAPCVVRGGGRYAGISIAPTLIVSPPINNVHKWVSVFPWRRGEHLLPSEVTSETAHRLGAALATMHVIGLELTADWRRASIYDHAHLVERYQRFATSTDPQLAHAIAIIGEELAHAERSASIRAAATHGIIHGDLFRDNVLWNAGEIVAVLDFEQASGGSLAYDLAVCINDWCWTGQPRLDLAGSLLAGYCSKRELPPADREALVIEVRAAAARFTITRITDVYLAKVTNPEKDFRAFLARSEAWRGPALHQLTALM